MRPRERKERGQNGFSQRRDEMLDIDHALKLARTIN